MTAIRIAHLSDLHASASNSAASKVVKAAIEDLKRAHSENPIDLIAFSGDLARTGTAADYELAHDWLIEPLRATLGLDMSRFVLVPGNHDVDRSAIDRYQEAGLRAALLSSRDVDQLLSEPEALSHASARLDAWAEYQSMVTDGVDESMATPLGRTRTLSIGKIKVGIAALNTAWRSSANDDQGYLLLGSRQVDAALANIDDCDLRIVVMHHPYHWLARFDADTARDAFESVRTLVLSGHDHVPDPTAELSLRGGAIYSRAGSLYESVDRLNGFTLIDVDLERGRTRFSLRSWYSAPRNEFDQATHLAKGGILEMGWIEHEVVPVSADYSTVLERLGQQASDLSVVGMLQPTIEVPTPEDVLVEPRLWPAPYKEIAAARDLDDAVDPEPSDPLAALDEAQVLIVTGEAESGVSGSLLWILTQHFEKRGTHTPYVTGHDRRFKASRFEKALRRNAAAAGQSADSGAKIPPSIAGIDDVVASGAQALIKFMSQHPQHLYVLGCHGEDADEVAEQLAKSNLDFKQVHLGPLGRAQVRRLIEKLGQSSEDEVNRVFDLIVTQHLPRTPLIVAALIVAIQQNQDPSSYNSSALLDAFVRVLLSAEDNDPGVQIELDPRHREHLLAWFAGQMSRRQITRMSPLKSEEELAAYFRARGWGEKIAPGDVLANLIHRRILTRDENGVGFRHDALQELFAGKRLNDDAEFAEQILTAPFTHDKAIGHAAGLRRDDRDLLGSVLEEAKTVLAKVDKELGVDLFDRIKDEQGWSDKDPDIEYLRALLAERPEPDQDDRDEQLDRFYDDLEYDSDEVPDDLPELLKDLGPATGLISSVLKNSELVPDVDLKVDTFKDALHGWSLIAILMAVEEDQTSDIHDRVESGDVSEVIENADDESAARVAELMIAMMMALVIVGSLASSQLEEVANRALDDADFMQPTAHALFATLFFVLMRFQGWDERLIALQDSHGSHPIVRHLTFSLATSMYKSDIPSQGQVRRLEQFLAERVTPRTGSKGGVLDGRVRSDALQELRSSRQKALMARELRGVEEDQSLLTSGEV